MVNIFKKLGNSLAWVKNTSTPSGYVTYELKTYQYNELWYAQRQGFLANFSSIKDPIYFTVSWNQKAIKLYIKMPTKYESYLVDMFYASFESSELKKIWVTEKDRKRHRFSRIKQFLKFSKWSEFFEASDFAKWWSYVDPFKEVLSFYFSVPEKWNLTIEYEAIFKVKLPWWKKIFKWIAKQFSPKEWSEKEMKKDEQQKQEIKESWRDVHFFVWFGMSKIETSLKNELSHNMEKLFAKFLREWSIKMKKKKQKTYANVVAFLNMFHIPTKANPNKSLQYVPYRKLSFPVDVPTRDNTDEMDLTYLWTTDFKDTGAMFGIKKEDKFRHIYIVWKTGMGKSTFISNMVVSDMQRNNGIAVVDPHGDLVEDVMAHIPSHRTNDVFLFDVSDTNYPVWFNILEHDNPDQRNLIASAVVSIFKKLFEHSRWPRLEYILRNVMLSILEYPNATLMHVMRMLTDKNFREEVLKHVKDPVVMKFRRDEYDTRQDRQKNEAVGPIANKIWQFLSSPIVRNIFAQPKSSLNIRKIMDSGQILLVNLSKGKIWEDNASMIWSFLVSKFQIDAMARADMSFKDRKDFYLYIDEFQNFATDAFESILSEARKYRLSLIVANQYTSQIQENVRNAIFGNVWSIVSFGLWYDDATMMSLQFKEVIEANDLLSLPKFTAYTKLMVDGVTSEPFSMKTFPLPDPVASEEVRTKIREQSRQRYAMPKEKLEELLKARAQRQFSEAEKISDKAKSESLKEDGTPFTIEDIKLWDQFEWYVKLKYNYWIFVTVKWVEWLLHKSQVANPTNVEDWKGLYEPGDTIKVKAQEWKIIDWTKRVVRTQKWVK